MLLRHRQDRAALGLFLALLALAIADARATDPPLDDPTGNLPAAVVNGVLSWQDPAVAILGTGRGICSAVLVGCRTALTAAHCVCPNLSATGCVDDPELTDPSRFTLFFQHAGFVSVDRVAVPPDFVFDEGHDVAVLELTAPVTGIRPVPIGSLPGAPAATTGTGVSFVGFGDSDGRAEDKGLKRFGRSTVAACTIVPEATHVCIEYTEPVGAPGEDSTTCLGDSGGGLFLGDGGDRYAPVLVGVASGADDLVCRPPHRSYFTELAVDLPWLMQAAGGDLGTTTCSDLPPVGAPEVSVIQGEGTVDFETRERRFELEVPPGVRELRVAVNGEVGRGNVDLYLRSGAPASADDFDCAGERRTPFELCSVEAPEPGTWHATVARISGTVRFQVTATLFGPELPEEDPPPPPGPWLTSSDLAGFRVKAQISAAEGGPVPGEPVERCIPETLCISGALVGRPEVFVKVIGPRPNGFLWVQISRFTPSGLEIWIEQLATGIVRYYRLDPVSPAADSVPGRQDRQAF